MGAFLLNVFSCYDLRHNCFVDFTGCGEHDQAYAYHEKLLMVIIGYGMDKKVAERFHLKMNIFPL